MIGFGAETLRVTITYLPHTKLKLDIKVPVADQQAEFKTLGADLPW